MSFQVYKRRGQRSYKEKKLIKEIENVFNQKLQGDPNFLNDFVPASNFGELKELHERFCIEDVTYIEQPKTEKIMENKKENTSNYDSSEDNSFIDPLNREEPVVRDYVLDDEFAQTKGTKKESSSTFFDEPTTFEDSFELPDEEEEQASEPRQSSQRQQRQSTPPPRESFNPAFDEMSGAKKKKSTKKMAKYIVEVVCALAQRGFTWYANKDINDAKLAEYELTGEIDLSLLVTLEDGQEATVKQFFQSQCIKAESLAKIGAEEKSDMTDALTEVLMEKGIAPTPMQELILISVGVFGKQFILMNQITSQNNALLSQLREMNEPRQARPINNPQPQPEPVRQEPKQEPQQAPTQQVYETKLDEKLTPEENLILDSPINTLE